MSFELEVSEKETAGAEFVVKLGKALQRALLTRKSQGKFTQQELALRLEVDRARVNRCFSGYANLTAESIGEIGWALGATAEIEFKFEEAHAGSSVKIIEFERQEPAQLNAQKVLSIGEGVQTFHVWVVKNTTSRHYSLPTNPPASSENVNTLKVLPSEHSTNWELAQ